MTLVANEQHVHIIKHPEPFAKLVRSIYLIRKCKKNYEYESHIRALGVTFKRFKEIDVFV